MSARRSRVSVTATKSSRSTLTSNSTSVSGNVKSTVIKINSIDNQLVGKVAAEIKMLKPVEPYKGKGIKEKGQYVRRKEGKKK